MHVIVFQNPAEAVPAKLKYLVYDCDKRKLSGKAFPCILNGIGPMLKSYVKLSL